MHLPLSPLSPSFLPPFFSPSLPSSSSLLLQQLQQLQLLRNRHRRKRRILNSREVRFRSRSAYADAANGPAGRGVLAELADDGFEFAALFLLVLRTLVSMMFGCWDKGVGVRDGG